MKLKLKHIRVTLILTLMNMAMILLILWTINGCTRVIIDKELPSGPTCSPCNMDTPAPVSSLGTKYSPMPLVDKKLFVALA